MINKNLLDELDRLGFGADVDALESYIIQLQEAASLGEPVVTDTVYDQHFNLLKRLRPDSPIFKRNWETDDFQLDENDTILAKYGMKSITTIQDMTELYKFKGALGDREVTLLASVKLNGHAVRAVYKYGKLVAGSTRGRYKKGRDITRHLRAVLPNQVELWADRRLVEVRGELVVSLENFEHLKHVLKTPLSAVTSLVRDSVTDGELKYLHCVCYKIMYDGEEQPTSLTEQMAMLTECGFKIPNKISVSGVDKYNLEDAVDRLIQHFEDLVDNGEVHYATDGIVVAVDDTETFESLGEDGNTYLGNFALKMGKHWESNIYSSVVLEVEFVHGKKYITPKALIEPVITVTGAEVSTVPLYNIGVMETLGLTPGNEIYFRFGGETGVTLVTPDGSAISSL